ncbi:hypothetical protein AOP6_0359 [Desulfuromonas sp. AOP6]|nr:hypothetical protein AOP6_0359 [Desulfuromonas sp. AOP6]
MERRIKANQSTKDTTKYTYCLCVDFGNSKNEPNNSANDSPSNNRNNNC